MNEEDMEKIKKQYDINMESAIRALGEKVLECEQLKEKVKELTYSLKEAEDAFEEARNE